MAKMCPMSGCKDKPGMCIHEKMIMGVIAVAVVLVAGMEIADLRAQLVGAQQDATIAGTETANLRAQLATAQPNARYWTQLSTIFMPVELRSMTDHKAFMTPGGLILALHFDNMDLSKAQNLNWVAIGVPGKFSKQEQERIEKQFGKGFIHFHDLMADTHGGKPGADGVWFMHIAVRSFSAPWGTVKPGVDEKFMPTPAP